MMEALATAAVVLLIVTFGPFAVRDSGLFAVALLGIPLAAGAISLLATRRSTLPRAALVTGLASTLALAWSVVTIVGLGLYLLPPALLLVTSAVILTVAAIEARRTPRATTTVA
ncbi:hypothetical protein [Pseudokineococcus sp. 1T1Z-3]|uniref:hypothetical protein n=1 Tax=Pseudokineococcus sp. 1T1Z-3 TaxID=3132745 RepID=UPI0030B536E5